MSISTDQAPKTQRRACPLCGATGGPVVRRHEPWQLVECTGCGLAYLPEIPTEEAVGVDFEWSESFAQLRRQRWLRSPWMRLWTALLMWLRPSRERRALRWIRRISPPPARLLDVGCGNGQLMFLALRAGYDPVGIELSPQMVGKALRRLPRERVLCGRLGDFDLPARSFDLVVTVSFLEHEPRPAESLRRMFELLRPGGICVHKVPNYDSLLRRLLGGRWSGYRWPEHMQYYTPATLGRLLRDSGFEVLATKALALADNFWIAARRPGAAR